LAVLQRELLESATGCLRPGGTLVYSVCTMTNAETLAIDDWLADRYPELAALERPGDPWMPRGRGALLLPQAAGTDGMYLLRLRWGDV
jgi:16S rRNA (cytosine967-C5)-methyltransferase